MDKEVKKGTLLKINHSRKGTFLARAKEDFNLDDEWYPIVLAVERVDGMNTFWEAGDDIPCRASLCKIEVWKKNDN